LARDGMRPGTVVNACARVRWAVRHIADPYRNGLVCRRFCDGSMGCARSPRPELRGIARTRVRFSPGNAALLRASRSGLHSTAAPPIRRRTAPCAARR
jgi:hypothetical protein